MILKPRADREAILYTISTNQVLYYVLAKLLLIDPISVSPVNGFNISILFLK